MEQKNNNRPMTAEEFYNSPDWQVLPRSYLGTAFAEVYANYRLRFELEQRDNLKANSAERFDAEEWLGERKDIWNHPRVTDRTERESYEVADLMAEFANDYYSRGSNKQRDKG